MKCERWTFKFKARQSQFSPRPFRIRTQGRENQEFLKGILSNKESATAGLEVST